MINNSCKKCFYTWIPRVEAPRKCPNCGRVDWNTETPEKDQNQVKSDIPKSYCQQCLAVTGEHICKACEFCGTK